MEKLMLALQVVSALLLLLNKFYVFKKKTIGWTFGIWGTVAITIYFYLQMRLDNKGNLWIMIVYDIALLFLMIYGYIVSSSIRNLRLNKLLKRWNVLFKAVVVLVTTLVCVVLLFQVIDAPLVIIQFLSVVGGLVATLLLAFNVKSTNKIGWVIYFITHTIVTYLMIKTDSPYIAICQVLSAIIALMGLKQEFKKSKLEVIPK